MMPPKGSSEASPPGRGVLVRTFLLGALVGVPVGMIWSWLDYGAFELGYMSNHVLGAALVCGLVALAVGAVRRWLWRNPL